MGDGRKKIFISFKIKDFTTFNKLCLTFQLKSLLTKKRLQDSSFLYLGERRGKNCTLRPPNQKKKIENLSKVLRVVSRKRSSSVGRKQKTYPCSVGD